MSSTIKVIQEERHVVDTITCDKCKETYIVGEDVFEIQEMIHLSDTGGYGSKIGDGVTWSLDLCQVCFLKIADEFIQIKEIREI